ncbi:hypothetical protein SAMN02745702_02645 [Desulfobaculum bizertense DSM 18034]|uniref:Uncharacterized protein n=1 Tax=Desulfobaculum bizertense DSM 18034 TaxID=1121442 RepID=A0A1T4WSQ9_9BACT|nr:hypothetical protein SAMN02745702_02645 [Desulfobaculum bizertense DSM 18034]
MGAFFVGTALRASAGWAGGGKVGAAWVGGGKLGACPSTLVLDGRVGENRGQPRTPRKGMIPLRILIEFEFHPRFA